MTTPKTARLCCIILAVAVWPCVRCQHEWLVHVDCVYHILEAAAFVSKRSRSAASTTRQAASSA
ncbi:hypothetical protein PF005_g17792 [Phytophthora fragariae]|uniref:Secreted protein n=1 Tax=Phytophthora fragariae TaxID=53985 RepID=A0A6A3XX22_9STRA|nr:hypothetical protein PF003_g8581 [Phytophthora fragariae]KAE8931018.1 hypothetical protein PF009_g18909 [Phytophthora fragariae]KAE8999417.1 hypothetical protein PF011_g14636 [Phytophthora fragariae]KAE9094889.1 hypothetical protein PF007_g17597 [Phytophthora fragariae]KAE9096881.1 hypothetical protein PF010_g16168 [Phytophthora fragariae]